MTNTLPLSARLAALEEKAAPLAGMRAAHADTLAHLAHLNTQIAEAEAAFRILVHLTDHVDRVLSSGDLLAEAPVVDAAPAPVDMPTAVDAETPAHDAPPVVQESPPSSPQEQPQVPPSAPPPANPDDDAEDRDDGEEQAPYRSNMDILTEYAQSLAHGEETTAQEAASATGLLPATVKDYLRTLTKRGVLEKVPGTGTTAVGNPARYRRSGTGKAAVVPPPSGDSSALSDTQPSTRAYILVHLREHVGQEFTAVRIAEDLRLDPAAIREHLQALHRLGTLSASPEEEDGTQWFCYPSPVQVPPPPAAQPTLSPIPDRLNLDERSMYDCLRREEAGLTARVLAARLNWSARRTDKILNILAQGGHIGRNGDRWRVIPAELQDEEGAA
ncbi:helix-turn-helix domain-containing protein [Deinococcus carri]|uniref:helix-turn-helix domain-containing protein n=1 Tax=Deinococcus carri TaxID=1211323 RepID=UPI0031E627CD